MELAELQSLAQQERDRQKPARLRCCTAAGCMSSGSQAVKDALDRAVAERGLKERVEVQAVGCLRLCCNGPLVQADPSGKLYEFVKPDEATGLLDSLDGKPGGPRRGDPTQPFFARQMP